MLTLYAALASLPCSPLDLDLTVAGPPRDVLPDLALVLSVLGAIKEQFQDWIRIEAAERKVATLLSLLDDLCIPRSGPAIVSLLSSVLAAAPLSPSRVPPRLFEAEAERAALGAVAWLTVSARTTFVAAMRLLSYAASLAPSAATAAVKALKTALPALSSASTGDDSIVRLAYFRLPLLLMHASRRTAWHSQHSCSHALKMAARRCLLATAHRGSALGSQFRLFALSRLPSLPLLRSFPTSLKTHSPLSSLPLQPPSLLRQKRASPWPSRHSLRAPRAVPHLFPPWHNTRAACGSPPLLSVWLALSARMARSTHSYTSRVWVMHSNQSPRTSLWLFKVA